MTDTAVVGVYYDSLGGDYNEKLQPHAWYYKTMLGLTEGATITWRKGSTSMELDGWTCGYRSMCVVLKILHLAEEGAYNAEYPPFIECSTTDVESMRTEKAPAMFAMTQGCLAYLPSGIFGSPSGRWTPIGTTPYLPSPPSTQRSGSAPTTSNCCKIPLRIT